MKLTRRAQLSFLLVFALFVVVIPFQSVIAQTQTLEEEKSQAASLGLEKDYIRGTPDVILPVYKDSDIALGTLVKSGDTSILSMYFMPGFEPNSDIVATYDILIPKSLADSACNHGKKIMIATEICYKIKQAQSLMPIGKTKSFNLSIFNDAEKGYIIQHGKDSQPAVEEDTFYRFNVKIECPNTISKYKGELIFCLSQKTSLSAKKISGEIYVDNIMVKVGGDTKIACDFNNRYGKRGEENLLVDNFFKKGEMGFTHGIYRYLSEIDTSRENNYIRVNVVTDGNNGNENYNPNFSSMTLAFEDRFKFKVGSTLQVSYDVVIPKAMFENCLPEATVDTSLVLVFDEEYVDSSANCHIVWEANNKIVGYKDGGGSYTVDSQITTASEVIIEEMEDSYIFHIYGKVEAPKSTAKKIWLKSMLSANNCIFDGFWYYNNFRVMSGDEPIIIYDVSVDAHPNTLVEFYTPTTNGIPYTPEEIIYGFGHVGFDKLKIQ